MQVSFTPILLLRMGSLLEVLEIKELGQRQAGVPHRRSLTFLPQAEEQVNSNRKKKKKKRLPGKVLGGFRTADSSSLCSWAWSSHLPDGNWHGRIHSVCPSQLRVRERGASSPIRLQRPRPSPIITGNAEERGWVQGGAS